ncbi:hypothetical protein [Flintibacter muris]|uniref:hypothetical protein n=1 Tax=Flintibacter muris TaxID=2941327 RepID=UPI00203C9E8F|nr:hypothetical protein [Flintibacter muris]
MEKINPTSGAADTPEPKVERSTADSFYCYIGPSITGLIQHGAIYRGTRKKAMAAAAAAIEKYPLIKTLIVSGDKLPEARLKVKKPGNALYKNYQRILGKA